MKQHEKNLLWLSFLKKVSFARDECVQHSKRFLSRNGIVLKSGQPPANQAAQPDTTLTLTGYGQVETLPVAHSPCQMAPLITTDEMYSLIEYYLTMANREIQSAVADCKNYGEWGDSVASEIGWLLCLRELIQRYVGTVMVGRS